MAGLLLCRTTEGKHPYYAKEIGRNLYSAEELSYYIYNHAFFLDESFFDEQLYAFLALECRMPALEKKLRTWAGEGADLTSLLLIILQDVHYYSDSELVNFRENMTRIQKAQPAERIKWQADFMLKQKKYESAIRTYEAALEMEEENPDDRLKGKILYNKGTACTRLFAFREALECFEEAYDLLNREEILNAIYLLYQLNPDIPMKDSILEKIPAAKQHQWQEELETMKKHASYSGKALKAREILDKNSIRRGEELEKLLVTWKQEYRDLMK